MELEVETPKMWCTMASIFQVVGGALGFIDSTMDLLISHTSRKYKKNVFTSTD